MSSPPLSDLQRKYAEERNKRLREDGLKQYTDLRGSDLARDPFIDYDVLEARPAPIRDGDDIKFLIVGGGHSGLLFAVRLIQRGFKPEDICIVDAAGGFGGTWYWNRYPGLMCDVESYIYLPLLEESGFIPTHKYSYGSEIRANAEHIAEKWGFSHRAMFSTTVDSERWDEGKGQWTVTMTQNRGPGREPLSLVVHAQFLLFAAGVMSSPHIPNLPGLDDFQRKNRLFHTSRWNYQLTGGTQEKPELTALQGRKVGVIGTGATAVQIVPELAKWADKLYVFQRTPSYCGPRNQRPTNLEQWTTQIAKKKGWQFERQENFNHFISYDPVDVDLVNDGWTDSQSFSGVVGNPKAAFITQDRTEEHIAAMFKMDIPRAERIWAHISHVVKDKEVAEKLKPWYPGWCKRPTFHDEYLDGFNKPNVTLVDTDGKGVERYTENGVVANGVEYELDILVLATGFSTANGPATCPTIGREGRLLSEKYEAEDWGVLFGLSTHGFPNLFFSGYNGGPVSPNLTSTFDMVAKLVAHIVAEASRRSGNARRLVIEAKKEGEDAYSGELLKRAGWFSIVPTCPPSYFNREGEAFKIKSPKEAALAARKGAWGGGPGEWWKIAQEYIAKLSLDGFEVSVPPQGQ
ncbi:Pyridine nucleotide-disulfide oxidoreductase [Macrophomina phaseolina MS6]|uniref:Pyridine nucleotide-disulfide oxidoreductase n=1 Tax=Macrophomina phaseolina (strain MS6) TaxID=1126212 RepID=K2RYZ2_MACPH|nr:Pyridine nucleotide-disulfide oxidoreductase [Macrophomina phaseolina MS6]